MFKNVNKIVVLQHKFINSQTIINDLNNKQIINTLYMSNTYQIYLYQIQLAKH